MSKAPPMRGTEVIEVFKQMAGETLTTVQVCELMGFLVGGEPPAVHNNTTTRMSNTLDTLRGNGLLVSYKVKGTNHWSIPHKAANMKKAEAAVPTLAAADDEAFETAVLAVQQKEEVTVVPIDAARPVRIVLRVGAVEITITQ
jgi:DNA-binding IclR family transcriptional regulator